MIVPLYQAEICHPNIRGRVTALQQFMLGVGALCAAWISYGTYVGFDDTNDAQWQVSLGLQIVPAVFLGLLIMLFPEVRYEPKPVILLLTCMHLVPSLAYRPWPPRRGPEDPGEASRLR
jgi:MFS family permease